jgi:hypothetical protein
MNKRMLWIILIVITLGVDSMAIDFMGPPTASLKQGQWKIGYTYDYSKNDISLDKVKVGGVDTGLGDLKIDDVKCTRNYFTANYGVATDRMEIYGFLGAVNVESKSYDLSDFGGGNIKFSGNNDFAYGMGAKVTTNIYDNADWGILVQVSGFKSKDSLDDVDIEIKAYELQVAAGPTIKIMNDWKVYGGPFLRKLGGNIETTNTTPKVSGDIKQDFEAGGYIGTQIGLFKNAAIAAEYAYADDSSGFGVNISWKF